jgi:hypothetical protein
MLLGSRRTYVLLLVMHVISLAYPGSGVLVSQFKWVAAGMVTEIIRWHSAQHSALTRTAGN